MVTAPPRFADRLDDALAGTDAPDPAAHRAHLDHLRDRLEAAAADAVELLAGTTGELPLRLPKSRLSDLGACPRFAVAARSTPPDPSPSPALLVGAALDRFVVHELYEGPVVDPVAVLTSMLDAEGDDALLEELQRHGGEGEVPAALGRMAAAARDLGGIGASWWPRTQVEAGLELAGGDVVSRGRVDLELGGPLTGRPGVVVELKSTPLREDHLAEVRHYALLVALRDGVPPALVVCWNPGAGATVAPVDGGTLDAAARRLADGIRAWAALCAGEVPPERPGGRCWRCPDADRCPSGLAHLAARPAEEEPWEPEAAWSEVEGDGDG